MNRNLIDMILYIRKMESKGVARKDIRDDLLMNGYSGYDIKRAINRSSKLLTNKMIERQLSPFEKIYLTDEAAKYLYQLVYYGVLSREQFESVIDDITNYSQHQVSKTELTLLISIMLFNENPDDLSLEDEFDDLDI